jgi:hypothetical protein
MHHRFRHHLIEGDLAHDLNFIIPTICFDQFCAQRVNVRFVDADQRRKVKVFSGL